jgi:hypothetical protein
LKLSFFFSFSFKHLVPILSIVVELAKGTRRESGRDGREGRDGRDNRDSRDSRGRRDDRRPRRNENG